MQPPSKTGMTNVPKPKDSAWEAESEGDNLEVLGFCDKLRVPASCEREGRGSYPSFITETSQLLEHWFWVVCLFVFI